MANCCALLRLDGAPLQSVTVAMNKAYTAAREGKPSSEIGAKMRDPQKGYSIAYFGDPRYTGFPGGVPVIVNGQHGRSGGGQWFIWRGRYGTGSVGGGRHPQRTQNGLKIELKKSERNYW